MDRKWIECVNTKRNGCTTNMRLLTGFTQTLNKLIFRELEVKSEYIIVGNKHNHIKYTDNTDRHTK